MTDRAHAHELDGLIAARYRILGTIAEGSSGTVYTALDEATQQHVALKRLKDTAPRSVAMFQREFYVLATLTDEHTVRALDYDSDETGPFFTMERLQGVDLEHLPQPDFLIACRVLRDVALALHALHGRHLVHRDVNPRNVYISQHGVVKLLDFGAVSPFGVQQDVVGIPPFVSPEAVFGQALDARSDLYALGALGFFMLYGRHAYPATSLSQLDQFWKRPVQFLPLVPAAPREDLTQRGEQLLVLIRSLLSQNPMGRPANAITLIDELENILMPYDGLSSAPAVQARQLPFFGRKPQLASVQAAFDKLRKGRGACLVLDAPVGVGKTRLLTETALELRIQGAAVLFANGGKFDSAYGVANALSLKLLDTLPRIAREAALPHAEVLAHLSPQLRNKLNLTHTELTPLEPAQRRVLLQSALHDWFAAVALERPLLLFADDFASIDEPSAAWITALAIEVRQRSMLIIAACSSSSQTKNFLLEALLQHSERLLLPEFNTEETRVLAGQFFENTPNVPRLAAFLQRTSNGNAAQSIELCEHLVATEVISRVDGIWVIPQDIARYELPNGLHEVFVGRLVRLSPPERALAEELSVEAGEVPITLLEHLDAGRLYSTADTLDRLVQHGVLERTAEDVRFCREELRLSLHSELDDIRRLHAHRQLGRAWASRADASVVDRLSAGVHLLRGGASSEGGKLVIEACTDLRGSDSYAAAAPRLEQALTELRRENRSERELVIPLACLSIAGYFVDRRLSHRYGEETLAVLERNLGLHTIRKLRPWIGAKPAILIGLAFASLGFLIHRRNPLVPRFQDALRLLFEAVTTLVAVHAICVDPREALRCAETLEPLSGLGPKHLANIVYRQCLALALVVQDHQDNPWRRLEGLLETLRSHNEIPGLEHVQADLLASALYARGVHETWRDESQALLLADDLENLSGKLYATYAAQIRMLHYAHRGRMHLAQEYERRVEDFAIRRGSAWQIETWSAAAAISIHFRTDNVLGMKRAAKELQQIVPEVPSLALLAKRAWGAYLLLRGQPAKALRELESSDDEPMEVVGWTRSQATRARAYNALGQHARARQVCREAMRYLEPLDYAFTAMNLSIEVELALAEMGLGNLDVAARSLDALLDLYGVNRNPLTLGSLHEARARVALAARQHALFLEHARAMRRWYLPTAIPTLIQRCDRLDQEAMALMEAEREDEGTGDSATQPLEHAQSPESCPSPRDLLALLARTAGTEGAAYLYGLPKPDTAGRLVASLEDTPPPRSLSWWVRECIRRAQGSRAVEGKDSPSDIASEELLLGPSKFRFVPLFAGTRLSGAAILEAATEDEAAEKGLETGFMRSAAKQLERWV